jgi:hypothetical protein
MSISEGSRPRWADGDDSARICHQAQVTSISFRALSTLNHPVVSARRQKSRPFPTGQRLHGGRTEMQGHAVVNESLDAVFRYEGEAMDLLTLELERQSSWHNALLSREALSSALTRRER